MFLRILRDSFFRQKRRKAVVLAAVALGTAAAAALADIALDIGDKVSRELKSFGANLVVLPKGGGAPVLVGGEDVSGLRLPAYLDASDILKAKDNFWKNNILALAPALDLPVRAGGRMVLLRGTWFARPLAIAGDPPFVTGLRLLDPYWSVAGRWPDDATGGAAEPEVLVGRALAESLGIGAGGRIEIEASGRRAAFAVAGVLSTGGEEDGAILAPIEAAWRQPGMSGRLSRILLSAMTTPESAVYERLGKNPKDLPPAEFERWTCTPFVSSIAHELDRVLPAGEARVIRRVADSEGTILRRLSGLMALIALMAALGSALTVTSALGTSVLERRSEIGLLKALGAGGPRVVGLFLAEAATLGFVGGVVGAGLGALMARFISASAFGSPVAIRPLSLPLAIGVALLITVAGSIIPARRVMRFRPFEVLRGL
ncbi:MAG TPA: ABC transporter permease [Candidatus Polarisedimenticolia bacterium]|nr:ABC transporter permease [Candidatus Polarisedimenticolia bacterium]